MEVATKENYNFSLILEDVLLFSLVVSLRPIASRCISVSNIKDK